MTAAASAPTPNRLTYEEYLEEFKTQPPTREPYSILDGVVLMAPSPRFLHQRIVHRLEVLLDVYEQSDAALRVCPAPLDVVIRQFPLTVRQPDVLVMSEAKCVEAGGIYMDGPITVAPELVIEVLSPSETRRTLGDKIADFQTIGVQECWIVSPQAETIEVFTLTRNSVERAGLYGVPDEVQSVVFPEVRLALSRIFA